MGISASHRRPTGLHLAESDAVAILDFPDHFGRALASCRRFHRFNRATPILVICTVQGSEQRVTLFEAGADQVLDEPFCRRELAARVASLVRRSRGSIPDFDEPLAELGSISPDGGMSLALLRDLERTLGLTETERLLLQSLGRAISPVSASVLVNEVFPGRTFRPRSSHLRVHMHRLRRKLSAAGWCIEGIHGRGYRLFGLTG